MMFRCRKAWTALVLGILTLTRKVIMMCRWRKIWIALVLGIIILFLLIISRRHNRYPLRESLENGTEMLETLEQYQVNTSIYYHDLWTKVNQNISRNNLYVDGIHVEEILASLAKARIVYVEEPPFSDYERGTSEKWLVTLDGGQRAMMKTRLGARDLWQNETSCKM